MSVHEDILIKYRLLKGSSITREKLGEIQSEGGRYRAYASGLYYAGFKMRTAKEMADYLKRKEFQEVGYPLCGGQAEAGRGNR